VASAPWQAPTATSFSDRLPTAPSNGPSYVMMPPPTAYRQAPIPGTNGLAIAALVLGLVGFAVPLTSIVAIVLGLVALSQLRSRPQQGRPMAISGVALGGFSVLLWTALVTFAILSADDEDGSGARGFGSKVSVESLTSGECFDGLHEGAMHSVTLRPCEGPHQAQVITTLTLPDGAWPGDEEVVTLAEDRCTERMEGRVNELFLDDLDVYTIYPQSAFAWQLDRSATCIVGATDGVIGTSVLQ
jgi:hypothetical protein